jgi:hypothetical protein
MRHPWNAPQKHSGRGNQDNEPGANAKEGARKIPQRERESHS